MAFTDALNSLVKLEDLEAIYYDESTGFIEIVAIDDFKIKQYLIEIYHETIPIPQGEKQHKLHLNKIYHNYAINEAQNVNLHANRHQIEKVLY